MSKTVEKMDISEDRLQLSRALSAAFEPVIDVCLEVGLTSPEMESLLRAVFVLRAINRLSGAGGKNRPISDVRVGLAVGLHRNEVRKIRSARAEATIEKRQRRHRTGRLISGWTSDPRFITTGGQPRDLQLRDYESGPGFDELVRLHLPGVSTGTALKELRRRNLVQVLPDEIIRLRRMTSRRTGITADNILLYSKYLRRLASSLLENLQDAQNPHIVEETKPIRVSKEFVPVLRRILERRSRAFLNALERECSAETAKRRHRPAVRIGVTTFTWEEDLP